MVFLRVSSVANFGRLFKKGKYIMNTSANTSAVRTVKLSWKTDKETGKKRETVSFEMPQAAYDFSLFSRHLTSYLNSVQDQMIREMIEAGKPVIQAMNSVSQEQMISWLAESEKSGRLTKEEISIWFDSELADLLSVAIADAMGVSDTPTPEQTKTVEMSVKGYKDKISALAGGATSYAPKVAEKLLKAVQFVDTENDPIAARFAVRLEKMVSASDDSLAAL